jgi:hypothetical protein
MAPLLASIVGKLSPLAVLGIVILAYGIGHVLRFNIMHVEPRSNKGLLSHSARSLYNIEVHADYLKKNGMTIDEKKPSIKLGFF